MDHISEETKKFVLNYFETVTQIEIVCFLYQNRGVQFSSQSVARQLFLTVSLTDQVLKKFQALDFVRQFDGFYQLNESCGQHDFQCIDSIASSFEENRKIYVGLMYDAFMGPNKKKS